METTDFQTQRTLCEFNADDGTLDLVVVQVMPGENRKIRDEISSLAAPGQVVFRFIEGDAIRCQLTGVSIDTVRTFEDAGWSWG